MIQVEWEFRGRGQMNVKERRVELEGTEYRGTEACLERTRNDKGLHCLLDSEELKNTRPKKKNTQDNKEAPLYSKQCHL